MDGRCFVHSGKYACVFKTACLNFCSESTVTSTVMASVLESSREAEPMGYIERDIQAEVYLFIETCSCSVAQAGVQ